MIKQVKCELKKFVLHYKIYKIKNLSYKLRRFIIKIYTSYFYKVRFFKPNMIPISTAKWDPKWYHDFKGSNYQFIDKNGVINGLRADILAPGPTASELCRGLDNCITHNPQICAFLKAYEAQLNALDFTNILYRTETLCERVRESVHYEGDPVAVFLVYETPTNACSERGVIQQWFKRNGIIVKEWDNVSVSA